MRRNEYFAALCAAFALGSTATSLASSLPLEGYLWFGTPSPTAVVAARLEKSLSGEHHADTLENAVSYLSRISGVEFEPLWAEQTHAAGSTESVSSPFGSTPKVC